MRLTSGRRPVPSDAMVAGWSAPGSAPEARVRLPRLGASARRRAFVVVGVAVLGLAVLLGASRLDPRAASVGSRLSAAKRQAISSAYGRLPLAFEQNRGQSDRRVEFLSRGAGYALALTARGPVLALVRGPAARSQGIDAMAGARSSLAGQSLARGRAGTLGMTFAGGNVHARLVASGRLPGRVNYLVGNDRRNWHTGVPTFSAVTYRGVWSGIDATFYGNQRRLEYDLRVAPGADPGRIALHFSGARSLRLDPAGNLVIGIRGGTVRELAPRAYQQVGSVRRAVASRYVVLPGARVGVRVGPYDRSRALVIDPVLAYASYLGGSDFEYGGAITVDAGGNAYVTGYTYSTDFPATAGAPQTAYGGGGSDAFVAKINPAGTALLYSTYLGGTGLDRGWAIAVDASGDAYIGGTTISTDFPVTTGVFQSASKGASEGFVVKLNAAGSGLVYSTYLGGTSPDAVYGIAIDASGDAYLTGGTFSSDFPVTPGAAQTVSPGGGDDSFVTELNPSASALLYSTYLGGNGVDYGDAIVIDESGDAYVAGATASTNLPVTAGAFQATLKGAFNAFAAEVNPNGSAFLYVTYLGGSGSDSPERAPIALDGRGDLFITGAASSPDFPVTPGAYQTVYGGGGDDAFVTEVNPTGTGLVYSTFLGGSGTDYDAGIVVDGAGNAYVAGTTSSAPDFPVTGNGAQRGYAGNNDAYVVKFNPAGSAITYATYLGGSGAEYGNSIAIDPSGNAYIFGTTFSSDFPVTPGAFQTTYKGGPTGNNSDAFIAKVPTLSSSATSVSCSPASLLAGQATSCVATVTDTDTVAQSTPTGTVAVTSSGSGSFGPGASCVLAKSTSRAASCTLSYSPSTAGAQTITAAYGGDAIHAASTGAATLTVSPPSGGGSGPPPRTSVPVLSSVFLTHSVFRVGARATALSATATRKRGRAPVGTSIRFTVSAPAMVSIVIAQRAAGRRSGRKCVAPRRSLRKHPSCTRILTRGTLTRSVKAGASAVAFSGRLGGRALRVGNYQATLTATDAAGRSRSRVVYFRVVRR